MTDVIKVALIAATPGAMSAILGIMNHRKVESIQIQLDGRLDQLLKATNAQGRQDERDEAKP